MACELTIIRSSSEKEALRERGMVKDGAGGPVVVDRMRSHSERARSCSWREEVPFGDNV
jgi:hypothetical protein